MPILSSIFLHLNPWISGSKTFEIYILAAGYKRDRADSKVPGMGGAILSDRCGSGLLETCLQVYEETTILRMEKIQDTNGNKQSVN